MLDIYTNNYSIVAQNNLAAANNSLAKSIERLSSGLRINHASDDASGLAISEKLRGQIRGLAKASMNAQDAISYLQTAEGGMEVIGDMLQRMRELAVQAGNGTYTYNDRKELQKEVDQLKSEINRISASTEYNTKKLLTGDATALWSADSQDIEAIIRGNVAEGNYRLDVSVNDGRNAVYKTDIMDLKNPGMVANIAANSSFKSLSFNTNVISAGVSVSAVMTEDATEKVSATASAKIDGSGPSDATLSATATTGGQITTSGYYVLDILAKNTSSGTVSYNVNVSFVDTAGKKNVLDTISIGTSTVTTSYLGNNISFAFDSDSALVGDSFAVTVQAEITGNTVRISALSAGGTANSGIYTVVANNGTATSVVLYTAHGTMEFLSMNVTIGTFDDGEGIETVASDAKIASETTHLRDIARFYNADGKFILDNAQELTIFGNGNQTTISIEGCDTVGVLQEKLNQALLKLGMGATYETSTALGTINQNLVNYIDPYDTSAIRTGANAVAGTFVIQSALLGTNSEIHFIGDEALINALSISNIQSAQGAQTQVTVTDAHTGKGIGTDVVCDNVLRGVIQGVDVKLNGSAGSKVTYDSASNSFRFETSTSASTFFLHVVDNRTEVQVGANEGQTFDISIAQMDTTSLEIDDAFVLSMELSQKAITKFDQALEKVTSARATVGAQINRLEYTMKNLSISRQNLIAAESRIRDLDVAEESATFTKNQILVNAATAMLAQANTLPQIALQLIGR